MVVGIERLHSGRVVGNPYLTGLCFLRSLSSQIHVAVDDVFGF
jgi:hypothetical protein